MTTDIKIFASDMDGTFLNKDKKFDESAFTQLIKDLHDQGKYFVVSTGRAMNQVENIFEPFNKYKNIAYVTQNGAMTTVDGHQLFNSIIEPQIVETLFNYFPKLSVAPNHISFSGTHHSYIPVYAGQDWPEFDPRDLASIKKVKTLDEITEPINKISVFWPEVDQKQMAKEIFTQTGITDLRVTSSGFGNLDFINEGISKLVGLTHISEHLQINPKNMAAFGDGENDLEMLGFVGHPFVMPNAPQFIRDQFGKEQHAIADNNNSGVIKTIEQIIKN